MKALFLFSISILTIFSAAVVAQSQDARGYIIAMERAGRPRPTPPACCRPFRSEGDTVEPIGGGLAIPRIIPVSPEVQKEMYRQSLEAYRIQTEKLRLSERITMREYFISIKNYQIRVLELEVAKTEEEVEKLKESIKNKKLALDALKNVND